jgi:Trk K+ transport system NAD-binding subunit
MTARVRRALIAVLVSSAVVVACAVVVFRYSLDLSWIDSLYFVVTMMTSVGFGDINLRHATVGVKLFGIFLMIIGPVALAAAFGIVADYIFRSHLEAVFGLRRRRMKDHVIVCGLGNVGTRVVEHLRKLGVEVVAVEKSDDARFLDHVAHLGVPVVMGDMRDGSILEEAGLSNAEGLVAACDEDLINLETGLLARDRRPDIRVVLRIFDQTLAERIQKGFGLNTAFSTSALSAPAFAMAAVDPRVVGSFFVDGDLMINIHLTVEEGSRLEAMTTEELREQGDLSILSHRSERTGERTLHPAKPLKLEPGDQLVVAGSHKVCRMVENLNRAGKRGGK